MADSYGYFLGTQERKTIDNLEEDIQKILYHPRYNAKRVFETKIINSQPNSFQNNATYEIENEGCVQVLISTKGIDYQIKDETHLVNGAVICIGFKETSEIKKSLDSELIKLVNKYSP